MAKESIIKLIGPEIKAKAGETVTLKAEFAGRCWSCIHERRSKTGYSRISDQQGSSEQLYDAVIHEDTTHFIFSIGDNGRPDLEMTNDIGQLWCPVTVVNDEPAPEPTPKPDEKQLGKFLFKYGLLGDEHIDEDNDDHSPGDTNDDWWDEDDFRCAMNIFAADPDVKFVENAGDVMECGSPKQGTPKDDYQTFIDIYDVNYWQVYGLRFFTCVGNHDFYGMFESRYGDIIMPERFTNYNSVSGSNDSVRDRIARISISGQGINGIVPARGRIVFDREDGMVAVSGQGDMNFMAYMSYVEMYQEVAGFPDSIAPTENRFSDEAIRCMTDYVMNNWDDCKDNLSSWQDGYVGMRNAYSKLNYWMKKANHLFVNLSVDYGSDVWPINDEWHDRMIHARTIIDLNANDPYIKRMVEYVEGTGYSKADEQYNYQYYSPNSLIWLKEIIENNQDKIIHVYLHHFMPHRVGNGDPIGDNLPKDGGYQYSDISKAGVTTAQGLNKGSNALSGIEFWFINKLANEHKNVIFFSGHSHISYRNDYHADNRDYPIVSPATGGRFVYTKASMIPHAGEGAWFVSLPSLSKPRYIEGGASSRRYEDAEATIVEIYENGLKIKGYLIRENYQDVYDPDKPLFEKAIIIK